MAGFWWKPDANLVSVLLMWTTQTIKKGAVAFIVIATAIFFVVFISAPRANKTIGTLLRLEDVPSSLANAECETWGMTDVLATCAFEIDPRDFASLLTGWDFSQMPASGGSYEYSGGPKVGREFPVAVEFSVSPNEFESGGRVSVVADKARSRVQLDYYEE
ncbi:MAG: hypothetical protein MK060_12665 [Blastomonas sp.]|jgi:hypothetical protein|uniref:hypothetical protein n=1 Tax=Blastomonas sp. TaxID=1909299 RepID=UPI0008303CF7|nr:hypothetical protein [Blastomonas sp.]